MQPQGRSGIDRVRLPIAIVLGLGGLVWLFQGIGVLPGSFMTGDPFWAVAGVVLLVASVAFAAWPRLRSR